MKNSDSFQPEFVIKGIDNSSVKKQKDEPQKSAVKNLEKKAPKKAEKKKK